MIQTVLGPIDPANLGVTSMHDHLLADARVLHVPAQEPAPASDRVSIENLGFLHWNLLALADNLVLDDADLAVAELRPAVDLGRTVVDLTSWGLGAQPAGLPEIARRSGMNVVAGCDVYLDRPHPEWIRTLDAEALRERLMTALEYEIEPGSDVRAGLLGIIGTSEPITRGEQRVLTAVGTCAGRGGAAVTVRLDPSARRGEHVLELLGQAGCPPEQVIFGNVDEFIDPPYLMGLAHAGATLEWCFGNEAYYRDGYKDPTDAERLAGLVDILDAGFADRCVLGCSIWTKTQLRAYGGMGYDHLLRRIVPALEGRGVGADQLDAMLVRNPARLLDRP